MVVTIVFFVVIFGLVVISHEFGHFLLAKANGIHVVEFSVGMGPKIFSFQRKETRYALRLLPIGGACMFEGEDGLEAGEGEESRGAFPNAPVWSRISTVLAGPLFNFLLGIIIALIMVQFIAITDTRVTEVSKGSPAEAAGLQAGDRILSLDGERTYIGSDITLFTLTTKGGPVEVRYERGGQNYTVTLEPAYDAEGNRYLMGISLGEQASFKGLGHLKYAWYEMRYFTRATFKSLGMLIGGRVGREDVAGPVGIAVNVVGKTYEETRQYGWFTVLLNMLNITLMLTVNLGILNLLPLPALDGGRLVFLLLEVFRGKPVPPEKEGMVHLAGLVFFMALMVVVFFNDLVNVFG